MRCPRSFINYSWLVVAPPLDYVPEQSGRFRVLRVIVVGPGAVAGPLLLRIDPTCIQTSPNSVPKLRPQTPSPNSVPKLRPQSPSGRSRLETGVPVVFGRLPVAAGRWLQRASAVQETGWQAR